jgi:NAD+ diphosphatase
MPLLQTASAVTFGGSNLDRAAHLRDDPVQLGQIAKAHILVLWRGKVLCQRDSETGLASLCFLPKDAPLLRDLAEEARLFLGLSEDGAAYFAQDLSDWNPELPEGVSLNSFVDLSEQAHPDAPNVEALRRWCKRGGSANAPPVAPRISRARIPW